MLKRYLIVIFVLFFIKITKANAIYVSTTRAKACIFTKTIKAYGKAQTIDSIVIYAPVSGVLKLNTRNIGSVRKSQLIATIEVPNLNERIKDSNKAFLSALDNYNNAKLLYRQKIYSKEQLNNAKIQYYQLKKQLDDLEYLNEISQIRAPFSGNLEFLLPNGVTVEANKQLAVLKSDKNLLIKGYIPIEDLATLKIGQNVGVFSQNHIYNGIILQIYNSINKNGFGIIFIKATGLFFPNQWVSIEVPISREKSYCIPAKAIVSKGEETYIFVIKNGIAFKKSVQLLGVESDLAYIRGNVKKGELIITKGADKLKNKVKINR